MWVIMVAPLTQTPVYIIVFYQSLGGGAAAQTGLWGGGGGGLPPSPYVSISGDLSLHVQGLAYRSFQFSQHCKDFSDCMVNVIMGFRVLLN